jgi:hypothetical protein
MGKPHPLSLFGMFFITNTPACSSVIAEGMGGHKPWADASIKMNSPLVGISWRRLSLAETF